MNILKAFSLISRTLFDVVVVMIGDAMDYLLKTGTGHHKLDWLERCLSVDEKSDIDDVGNDVDSIVPPEDSPEARKGTYARLRSASKPHSTPQTLKWLEENYEIADGVCIPRSTLYVHYLDFCERNDTQPVNAASFGKIIRQQFTQITTRRLGTRGQSKYHYYGIGVRESSHYFEVVYSAKGVQSSMDGRKDPGKQIIAYSPRSKLGTLLPDFPDIKDIDLPANVPEDKVLTFLMMYRTHCQRILDTVIRANFDEVQSFLLHFWQGMPNHIRTILESRAIVTLVGVCDSILYRAIANVLMPTVLQPLPESLTQVIRKFSMQLDDWLRQALDRLPPTLQRIKFDLSRRFAQVLKRQTSLNHLCQAARTVIHSAEITSQMLDDWINVDLNSIVKQTLYTMDNYSDREHNFIVKLTQEFEVLLEEQSPLESYIEWLDGMVDQCVVQASKASRNLRRTARQFLLMWSCFGTRVIRDMTLHSAPSFGSFHLLHLMFDEYVLYLVENLHCQERGNELLRAAKGEQNIDFLEDSFAIDPGSASPSMRSPSCVTSRTCARDLDRRSVIRGPEYTQPQTGRLEGFPYISPPQSAVGGCVPNVNIYKEMPDGVSEGPPPAGHFPPTHHPPFAQPTYPPHATSRQHLYHQVTDPRDNSASLAIKQTETHTAGNNASAHAYDWYDWSSRPVTSHAGTNNNINKNNNMDGHFVRNHTVSRLPESDGQMYSNFQGSDLQAGIQSFSQCGNNNNSYKRTITDNQSGKRKLNDDISGVNYKHNMADLYQYHMTSLI